jgi:hypothetical protein
MHISRRYAVAFALAVAGVLAITGFALAAGHSTATFKFSPSNVPKRTFQKGTIHIHTHTMYTGTTQTDRAQLNFDDDFKINPKAAPKCAQSKISGTKTMAQAMRACGGALIGKGTAQAKAGVNTVHACVLAFNGKLKNRQPTVLLFTRAQAAPPFTIKCARPKHNTKGNTNVLLRGVFKKSKLGGDFGKVLDFNNIAAASPLPLTDFSVTAQRGNYVSARCHDGNHKWNLKTKFTYTHPNRSQTVASSQTCS